MNAEFAKNLADQVARFYETYGNSFSATRHAVWAEQKLIAGLVRSGMTVVDVGAGNGRLATQLPSGVSYVGFEPSAALRAFVMSDTDLRPGALPNLPLKEQSADLVACIAVFHHLPSTELRSKCVDELVRITKPGGLIVASSWFLQEDNPRLTHVLGGDAGDFFMSWNAEVKTGQRYVHLFDETEWMNLWTRPDVAIERIGLFGREDWTDDRSEARNWMVVARRRT